MLVVGHAGGRNTKNELQLLRKHVTRFHYSPCRSGFIYFYVLLGIMYDVHVTICWNRIPRKFPGSFGSRRRRTAERENCESNSTFTQILSIHWAIAWFLSSFCRRPPILIELSTLCAIHSPRRRPQIQFGRAICHVPLPSEFIFLIRDVRHSNSLWQAAN